MTLLAMSKALTGTKGKERQEVQKLIDQEARKNQVDPNVLESLSKVVDRFYRDRLVIKVLPFDDTDVRLVGTLRRDLLRDSLQDIRFKYGSAPNADWTVFGQIASIPMKDDPSPTPELYFANELDASLSGMFGGIHALERLFSVISRDCDHTHRSVPRLVMSDFKACAPPQSSGLQSSEANTLS